VNTYRPVHWMLPYGGYNMSGIGRENGAEGIQHFLEVKALSIGL